MAVVVIRQTDRQKNCVKKLKIHHFSGEYFVKQRIAQ